MKGPGLTVTSLGAAMLVACAVASAGLFVGIRGIREVRTARQDIEGLRSQLAAQTSAVAKLETEISDLRIQSRNAYGIFCQDLENFRARVAASQDLAQPGKGVNGQKPGEHNGGGAVYHTIRDGDLLGKIAKQYATTAEAIERFNPGLDDTRLRIGRKIRVK